MITDAMCCVQVGVGYDGGEGVDENRRPAADSWNPHSAQGFRD